jgi:hypothetical protein
VAFDILDLINADRIDWPGTRCSSPNAKTLSQDVRKASAVSFYDSRRGASLPLSPGNFFDAAATALEAPHGVQKEDERPPHGSEIKAQLSELVANGRRQVAARADRGRTLARSHGYFDTILLGTEVGVLVDNTSE